MDQPGGRCRLRYACTRRRDRESARFVAEPRKVRETVGGSAAAHSTTETVRAAPACRHVVTEQRTTGFVHFASSAQRPRGRHPDPHVGAGSRSRPSETLRRVHRDGKSRAPKGARVDAVRVLEASNGPRNGAGGGGMTARNIPPVDLVAQHAEIARGRGRLRAREKRVVRLDRRRRVRSASRRSRAAIASDSPTARRLELTSRLRHRPGRRSDLRTTPHRHGVAVVRAARGRCSATDGPLDRRRRVEERTRREPGRCCGTPIRQMAEWSSWRRCPSRAVWKKRRSRTARQVGRQSEAGLQRHQLLSRQDPARTATRRGAHE